VNAVLSPQSKLLSVQKKRKLRPDPDIINSDEIISDETTTIINEEAEQQAKRMRRVVTITGMPPLLLCFIGI
jgi:hypothetical protein